MQLYPSPPWRAVGTVLALMSAVIAHGCSFIAPSDEDLLAARSVNGGTDAGGSSGSGGGSGGEPTGGTGPVDLCSNGRQDQGESGKDCGGICPARCDVQQGCSVEADCITRLDCIGNTCLEPSCGDGAKNGTETDIDCGGSSQGCPRCLPDKACITGGDCESRVCNAENRCAVGTCSDGFLNQSESSIDCGGTCASCPNGRVCFDDSDCGSAACAPVAVLPEAGAGCAASSGNCLCEHCSSEAVACADRPNCRSVLNCFLTKNCDSFEECSAGNYCANTVNAFGGMQNTDVKAAALLLECAVLSRDCRVECQAFPASGG